MQKTLSLLLKLNKEIRHSHDTSFSRTQLGSSHGWRFVVSSYLCSREKHSWGFPAKLCNSVEDGSLCQHSVWIVWVWSEGRAGSCERTFASLLPEGLHGRAGQNSVWRVETWISFCVLGKELGFVSVVRDSFPSNPKLVACRGTSNIILRFW